MESFRTFSLSDRTVKDLDIVAGSFECSRLNGLRYSIAFTKHMLNLLETGHKIIIESPNGETEEYKLPDDEEEDIDC
jgi:hypothetical protein